jgi:hypothetical protein
MKQGSKQREKRFREANKMYLNFDYSYCENALPYAKKSAVGTWKNVSDKAAEIEPIEHLKNHGWYNFSFLNKYKIATNDVDKRAILIIYDIDYKMDTLCYFNL